MVGGVIRCGKRCVKVGWAGIEEYEKVVVK